MVPCPAIYPNLALKTLYKNANKNKKGACFAINKVGIIMIELNACYRAKYICSYITSNYKPYPQPYLYVKKDSKLKKRMLRN